MRPAARQAPSSHLEGVLGGAREGPCPLELSWQEAKIVMCIMRLAVGSYSQEVGSHYFLAA